MLVVPDRSGGARRPLPARKRDALHPASAAALPDDPRLRLAHAFVSEQQWLRGGLTPEQEREVVRRYEEAMKFPETEPEARVRAARFLYALGNFERALELPRGATRQSTDKEVRYFADLVRGQVLRALQPLR